MKLYKLTNSKDQTRGGCQWGEGVCVETSGQGELCSSAWTHWYTHPLLAVLLDPIHLRVDLDTAHLWEGHDGGGKVKSDPGLKVGCTRGTTVRRVDLPTVTLEHRVRFAIGCAWQVCEDDAWREWAAKWLSGEDRAADAAARAARAAWEAARAAERAAARAERAAWAAARATARAAWAWEAEWVAWAAWAARADAAYTALWVADATIDLELIAEWAVGESIEVPDAKEKSND